MLRLFAEAGVHAGDTLTFVEIGERWVQTGLRASDLRNALQNMVESGDIVSTERDHALRFGLSNWAFRSLHAPDGELQTATPEDETELFNARYRPRSGPDAGLRRRAEDQPPDAAAEPLLQRRVAAR